MKWFMVILAILVAIAVGIYVLDVANLIDVKAFAISRLNEWEVTSGYLETYRLGLQEEAILQEKADELAFYAAELDIKEQELLAKETLLKKTEQELAVLGKNLENDEIKLEKERDELLKVKADSDALKAEATLLGEMEIQSILKILENLPEKKQVSLLANMDQDRITDLLESMEPQKAATLLSQVSRLIEGR